MNQKHGLCFGGWCKTWCAVLWVMAVHNTLPIWFVATELCYQNFWHSACWLFILILLFFFFENKDGITHCFLSLCFYFGQYFILLCFGILIWNPLREARHGFPARDKKHEIRLDVRKWPLNFLFNILYPPTQKRGWNWQQNKIFVSKIEKRKWVRESLEETCQEERDVVARSFHRLHCFQSEPNQTKASLRAKEAAAFEIKAAKESHSRPYSPKPLFSSFFHNLND